VLLNNPEKEIVINMDNHVSYAMFNDEVRRNLRIYPDESMQYSYFDYEGDRVLFNTEEEFKEFLSYGSSTGYMMTIFAHTQPKPTTDLHKNQSTAASAVKKISPEGTKNKSKEDNNKEKIQPQFNIKYQLPLGGGRQYRHQPAKQSQPSQTGNNFKVRCDYCKQEITNLRYKCLQCPDYDLCEKCEDLKCRLDINNQNQQIHSDDHIFAKIPSRNPVPRPVPFICVPGNSPIVCARHGLRRIPVSPEYLRPKNERAYTFPNKLNAKPNSSALNYDQGDRQKKREIRHTNGGEIIQELEHRVQELEQQFTTLKCSPSPTTKRTTM